MEELFQRKINLNKKQKIICCFGKVDIKSIATVVGCTYSHVISTLRREGLVESSPNIKLEVERATKNKKKNVVTKRTIRITEGYIRRVPLVYPDWYICKK